MKKLAKSSYDLEDASIHIVENSRARRDVEMKERITGEESKFGSNWNITDIKQITHKMGSTKILKLINNELEIEDHLNTNPFNLQQDVDKLLINKWSDIQHLEDVWKTYADWRENCKLTPSQIIFISLQIL